MSITDLPTGAKITNEALTAELNHFGARVREQRHQRGMSLPMLARRVVTLHRKGMSSAMLGAIERGQRRPTLAIALAIAAALEMPLGYLLEPPFEQAEAPGQQAGQQQPERVVA